jgi:flavin-dependent dehydrogenase
MTRFFKEAKGPIHLEDGATIMVVGGGPAGAFFAILMLRKARQLSKRVNVLILEKKRELQFYQALHSVQQRVGCNFCAGGLSPRLIDVLEEAGLRPPDDILQGKIESLTVHGSWKNIELPVPEGRKISSVFRGSRPKDRPSPYANFDSYLLEKAVEEGARVITGKVQDIRYSDGGKPVVAYSVGSTGGAARKSVEVDFLVLAAGVNRDPGIKPGGDSLSRILREFMPRFRSPQVRKSLICELRADEENLQSMSGELHFAQYGSREIKIEMSSLIPKVGYITVALLGPSVDEADHSDNARLVQEFLELPHIRRLLPGKLNLTPICICNPNMTVGAARHPFEHRTAVIGDMVVSRLYKDGILSSFLTAAALADCISETGVDQRSLKKKYWPVIKRLKRDTWYGKFVFLLNRVTFSNRVLSRILYQAVITERKTKPQSKRKLAHLLWKIASGDDTYASILASMFHPDTLAAVAIGGTLVTARNYLAERVLGLKWGDFGRHPTAIPMEVFDANRLHFAQIIDIEGPGQRPEFESMYSIKIRGTQEEILRQLGKFGDPDRQFFRPRGVNVHRTTGQPNEVGSVVRYGLPLRWLAFSISLERNIEEQCLIYRVRDGFAKGGVLVFEIGPIRKGLYLLSIYVGFSFPRPKNPIKKVAWRAFKLAFPGFVHDVIWNHSLCKLKDLVENDALSENPKGV